MGKSVVFSFQGEPHREGKYLVQRATSGSEEVVVRMTAAAVERFGLRQCQNVARWKIAAGQIEDDGTILVTTSDLMGPTPGAT